LSSPRALHTFPTRRSSDLHATARLTDAQAKSISWLAAQPGGPAKALVIAEDWSSDCRRDLPYLARLAEAGGLELRIFVRDGDEIDRKSTRLNSSHQINSYA